MSSTIPVGHSVRGREVRVGLVPNASANRVLGRVFVARRGPREIGVGRGRAFTLAMQRAHVGSTEHDGPGRLSFVPIDLHGRVTCRPGRRDQRRRLSAARARARFGGTSPDRVHRHGRQVQRTVSDRWGQKIFVRGWCGGRFSQSVPLDPAVRLKRVRN